MLQIQYKTSSKLITNKLHTSSCHYYVTGLVPIVRGQFPRYEKHAPPGSYINADAFFSAEDLANYLHYLIENPVEYMKYFQWKRYIKLSLNFSLDRRYYPLLLLTLELIIQKNEVQGN